MRDISKKSLEEIKNKKISPKSRWYFLTRNYFFWFMFGLTTILGGIAFGMILLIISDLDWDIHPYLGLSLPGAVVVSLPYLWIALLLFFLFITCYHFIHTRTGYRYRFIIVFFLSLLIGALLGFNFYQYGWTEAVEKQLRERAPVYQRLVYSRENQWMHPEKGLLCGAVTEIMPEKTLFLLKDYLNKKWEVNSNQARVKGNLPLARNQHIKIIGSQLSDSVFKATEIRITRGYYQLIPTNRGRD